MTEVAWFTTIEIATDFKASEFQDGRFRGIVTGWGPPEREGLLNGDLAFACNGICLE